MNTGRNFQGINAHPLRDNVYRDVARLAAEALAAGLLVSLVLALAIFIVSTQAQAAGTDAAPGQGTLLFKQAGDEAPVAAPLLFTDVRIAVSGMTARATVTQRFVNPTAQWQEGIYVFPLPEKAAVDHLEMRIGERRIEGQIRERAEARAVYEQAKKEGRKATLVEQERPNVFTTNVAHIGPGEEIAVTIEYQETLRYDTGSFRLRFPMVVAPRYIPGAVAVSGEPGTGWGSNTDTVPDAARITPPVAHPSQGFVNPVAIAISLNPGYPLSTIDSPYHRVDVSESADHRYAVTLANGPVPANRDFELVWTPDVGAAPGAAVFAEQKDGRTYALAMVLPPSAAANGAAPRSPREAVFIIDTSGSMEGTSIGQAKEALKMALDRLQPGDRFNVIEFNSVTKAVFTEPMPVDTATLAKARSFVAGLRARGGTEMKPALEAALTADTAPGFVRQVVFLTDGAVGNEGALIHLIRERLSDRRLFTIGIGSAPNSFFLTKAAQFGRGTFTFIGDVREVAAKMGALFTKLESPVLTDISIAWPGAAEMWPREIGDLYAGEPIVVVARMDALAGNVTISGQRAGMPWSASLPLAGGAHEPGIGVLWARAKIEALTDALKGGESETEIRKSVIDVAVFHHLVSKYTSLVAVDVTPTAPPGTVSTKSALPTNLPEGWSFDAVFGGPQTATPATLHALAGIIALLLAAALVWHRRTAPAGVPLAVAVCALALAGLVSRDAIAQSAGDANRTVNLLLVSGHYDNDVGSFELPAPYASLAELPNRGWIGLDKGPSGSTLREIVVARNERPAFLRELEAASADTPDPAPESAREIYYLNVPGIALSEGAVPEVPLKRRALVPKLDYRYTLSLGATTFALTVRNGLNGRDGAYYAIEVGGGTYEYLLAGYGWESGILFGGDLDSDGKPDFVVHVSGNNHGTYYLLLSSQAKPGMNAPVATLVQGGC